MVYEVVIPLAGFEDEKVFHLEKIDDFLSLIRSEPNNIEIRVINFQNLKDIEFDIDDETAHKLQLTSSSSYCVHYILVLQNPVQKSIVNLLAPLIFNNDKKIMGQIQLDLDHLGLESLENLLPEQI